MEHDAKAKRASFFTKFTEVREFFASPIEVLNALKVYCSSSYGCMLWDLAGDGAVQVFNSWSISVRLTWSVPRATRLYLVQQVLSAGMTSAKVDIMARYMNYLRKSRCYDVAVLANLTGRDIRSTTGSKLRLLQETSGLNPWECSSSKMKMTLIQLYC